MNQINKIKFEVETSRVLQVLAKDIYDSPLALLRENVQNAYDAILMESKRINKPPNQFKIELFINNVMLEVRDNGIGMSLEILKKHFWKPGSSGKKTDFAKEAGVVGTFGIGALANFGVCNQLEVFTKAEGSNQIHSWVKKENIKIGSDCIEYKNLGSNIPNGTTIKAYLNPEISINSKEIEDYLKKYVRLIPVKLVINGQELMTSSDGIIDCFKDYGSFKLITNFDITDTIIKSHIKLYIFDKSKIAVELKNIFIGGQSIQGFIYLVQGESNSMAYRNHFGLSNIPFYSQYNLGGIVNLDCLVPTAGREAISKESINLVQKIINILEKEITTKIADIEEADNMQNFINYISQTNHTDLAKNISIDYEPNKQKIKLSEIEAMIKKYPSLYYKGNDESVKDMFSGEGSILFILSRNSSRGKIQENYLSSLGIREIPDDVHIKDVLKEADLRFDEISLSFKLKSILEEDYFISNVKVSFCKLSHNIQILIKKESKNIIIYIHRDASVLKPLYEIYKTEYGMFESFIKDFIRSNLYNKIQQYIPSSHKKGTDALKDILSKKRELYKYNKEEIGDMESYLKGDMSFDDIIKKAKLVKNAQTQKVALNNVGTISEELPTIEGSPKPDDPEILAGNQQSNRSVLYSASPAIIRLNSATDKKMLKTTYQLPQLNNFDLFLGLSDRLVKMDRDFFMRPHATKIIWGSHRVIYIFSHSSKEIVLYYNIELTDSIATEMGSLSLLTTTIITKDRIFVPVPQELTPTFDVKTDEKQFYVTYDIL